MAGPDSKGKIKIMRKTLAIAAVAIVTVASSLIATTGQADAQFRRWGPALGVAAGVGIVTGAIIANSGPHYERCGWVHQRDQYGNYMGRFWVCN
jgi:hypothetical protein